MHDLKLKNRVHNKLSDQIPMSLFDVKIDFYCLFKTACQRIVSINWIIGYLCTYLCLLGYNLISQYLGLVLIDNIVVGLSMDQLL